MCQCAGRRADQGGGERWAAWVDRCLACLAARCQAATAMRPGGDILVQAELAVGTRSGWGWGGDHGRQQGGRRVRVGAGWAVGRGHQPAAPIGPLPYTPHQPSPSLSPHGLSSPQPASPTPRWMLTLLAGA